jgi:mannose-6-phosphate isomerase-like protein (cupin superfamily)
MLLADIAAQAQLNDAFRRVVFTTGHVQVVLMTLRPGEDIGAEVHAANDQVLHFVTGNVQAEIEGETRSVGPGDLVVVPAGVRHNFTNTGDAPARLYTIYGPPDHAADTVHLTKADAEAAEQAGTDVPPAEHS